MSNGITVWIHGGATITLHGSREAELYDILNGMIEKGDLDDSETSIILDDKATVRRDKEGVNIKL